MERKVAQAYLYDFYGELLNAHQRRIYEDFIFHDLTLAEIAEAEGISRQGVHDLVKRCTKALEGYEAKLHLVRKFLDTKGRVEQIHQLAGKFRQNYKELAAEIKIESQTEAGRKSKTEAVLAAELQAIEVLDQIEQLSNTILEEF